MNILLFFIMIIRVNTLSIISRNKCYGCIYYYGYKNGDKCRKFMKINNENILIKKMPQDYLIDKYYLSINEARQDNTLCGENATHFSCF